MYIYIYILCCTSIKESLKSILIKDLKMYKMQDLKNESNSCRMQQTSPPS